MNKAQIVGFCKDALLGLAATCLSYGIISGSVNSEIVAGISYVASVILNHVKNA